MWCNVMAAHAGLACHWAKNQAALGVDSLPPVAEPWLQIGRGMYMSLPTAAKALRQPTSLPRRYENRCESPAAHVCDAVPRRERSAIRPP
jgi:hypothetical protein